MEFNPDYVLRHDFAAKGTVKNMNNLTDIKYVRELLQRHGFSFSKGLGQNFLINPSVCPKIAELGNAREGFGILEIGTGIGTLTAELAKRADKVVAIEIDGRLLPVLEETLSDFDNIKVINDDIMKVNLKQIIEDEFAGLKLAVCANLPYYLTSPIIMMLLENNLPIESITVMVQKEAAQRLCAQVGTRMSGAITVAVNYYGNAESLFNVSRGSFMPAPNVDSAVIRITINREKRILDAEDEKFFFSIVRAAFSQRRKTLANSVSSMLGIPKENIYHALNELDINESIRAEQMSMENMLALSKRLKG